MCMKPWNSRSQVWRCVCMWVRDDTAIKSKGPGTGCLFSFLCMWCGVRGPPPTSPGFCPAPAVCWLWNVRQVVQSFALVFSAVAGLTIVVSFRAFVSITWVNKQKVLGLPHTPSSPNCAWKQPEQRVGFGLKSHSSSACPGRNSHVPAMSSHCYNLTMSDLECDMLALWLWVSVLTLQDQKAESTADSVWCAQTGSQPTLIRRLKALESGMFLLFRRC